MSASADYQDSQGVVSRASAAPRIVAVPAPHLVFAPHLVVAPHVAVLENAVPDTHVENQPGDDEGDAADAAEASDMAEVGRHKFTIHKLSDMSPGSKAIWFRLHTHVNSCDNVRLFDFFFFMYWDLFVQFVQNPKFTSWTCCSFTDSTLIIIIQYRQQQPLRLR